MRGGDIFPTPMGSSRIYFNPRGARQIFSAAGCCYRNFNPRAPRGARPQAGSVCASVSSFQSTRPTRGATGKRRPSCRSVYFNPRAPRGARRTACYQLWLVRVFQSTRPTRGATISSPLVEHSWSISIHAPHAGRDPQGAQHRAPGHISIHAPHAGRDPYLAEDGSEMTYHFNPRAPRGARHRWIDNRICQHGFQSTRPTRGATETARSAAQRKEISIHAPHAGRDCKNLQYHQLIIVSF